MLRVECQPRGEDAQPPHRATSPTKSDRTSRSKSERLVDEGLTAEAGAARRPPPFRQRRGRAASVSTSRAGCSGWITSGRICAGRAQRRALSGRRRRRGRLARRRHRRDHRHADDPRRRLPPAAGAVPRARDSCRSVQVGSPDQPITPIGNRVPGALYAIWRDARLGSRLAAATPNTDPRRAHRRSHRDGARSDR